MVQHKTVNNFYLLLTVFLLCGVFVTFGQAKNSKIKVILMGTFHFGATSDRNSSSFKDLFSDKRQKELDFMVDKLNAFGVNKIFVETDFRSQKKSDSLYSAYKNGLLTDSIALRREEVQIAFRLGRVNNLPIIAADNRQVLDYNAINEYEQKHKNDKVNVDSFFEIPNPFTQKLKKLADSTLPDYYIQLNSAYSRQANQYDYLHYAMSYGEKDDFTGQQFTLSFYDRNLKIYNLILRNLDIRSDHVVLVLFGAAHTNIMRQFFENHPYFEIVELETVFK